jgi:hypothetical protein
MTVYAVTNLTAARPTRPLADCIRGHWGIEALHHLRHTTFGEGRQPGPHPHRATGDG